MAPRPVSDWNTAVRVRTHCPVLMPGVDWDRKTRRTHLPFGYTPDRLGVGPVGYGGIASRSGIFSAAELWHQRISGDRGFAVAGGIALYMSIMLPLAMSPSSQDALLPLLSRQTRGNRSRSILPLIRPTCRYPALAPSASDITEVGTAVVQPSTPGACYDDGKPAHGALHHGIDSLRAQQAFSHIVVGSNSPAPGRVRG